METCGLTAEYNPFHRGHARQLGQIREIVGPDGGLVVCLSGPFCQHGVPALLDKGTRAEIALRQGADLVLELPQAFAVASAERFAEGAIETLLATGVVRRIAYGSECPEHHSAIREVAALLAEEPPELAEAIREGIRRGKGFAASRAEAAARLSGGQAVLTILQSPNAILAVEYEKALMKARLRGDSNTADGIATHALPLFEKEKYAASQIRRIIAAAQACRDHERGQGRSGHLYQEICQYLTSVLPPESTAAVMQSFAEGRGLVTEEQMAPALLLSPLFRDTDALRRISGMQGGLAERLCGALRGDPLQCGRTDRREDADPESPAPASPGSRERLPYDDFIRMMATRAFPASRVRRAILAAAMHIESGSDALCRQKPQYIRVLGFTRRGKRLLSFMRETSSLPVIINASDYRSLKEEAAREQAGLDLYAQALWNHQAKLGDVNEFDRRVLQLR